MYIHIDFLFKWICSFTCKNGICDAYNGVKVFLKVKLQSSPWAYIFWLPALSVQPVQCVEEGGGTYGNTVNNDGGENDTGHHGQPSDFGCVSHHATFLQGLCHAARFFYSMVYIDANARTWFFFKGISNRNRLYMLMWYHNGTLGLVSEYLPREWVICVHFFWNLVFRVN